MGEKQVARTDKIREWMKERPNVPPYDLLMQAIIVCEADAEDVAEEIQWSREKMHRLLCGTLDLTRDDAVRFGSFFGFGSWFVEYCEAYGMDEEEHVDLPPSPPGETMRDILEERGLSSAWLGDRLQFSDGVMLRLLEGGASYGHSTAVALSEALGSTPEFWMAREKNYRDALVRESTKAISTPIHRLTKINCTVDTRELKGNKEEAVDHPQHYGGEDSPTEAIKVIEAWGLGFHLGNAVKYIARAGKKGDEVEDLKKAHWYLVRKLRLMGVEVDSED